ncbi:hypothetical protein P353_17855 [Comamonas testosteroni]|uniref:Uncharacterized protein n=1 Tax=Comamonas testosteroni TaxID=285 RepID=A0A096FCR0_COMTE|nr:hypothetical protein P353_17855 [Comamonas testosteroni]
MEVLRHQLMLAMLRWSKELMMLFFASRTGMNENHSQQYL